MIEISSLYKAIHDKPILKNINLKVEKGSIFGLIGPNGAGKTTLIKTLTGVFTPDAGSIKVLGEPVLENPKIKEKIGYVADENQFFDPLNIKEIKRFYKLAYKSFDQSMFDTLNEIYKLPEKKTVKKFSKGMKMRLSIMLNLSIKPEVLILDEPTSGLDPLAKRQFVNMLLQEVAERGTTTFISSHNLDELERICDSIAIISNGEIKYANSIENMKRKIRKVQVVFNDRVPEDLEHWVDVIKVEKIGRVYSIVTNNYSEVLIHRLEHANIAFHEEIDLSLEDMFIYSVGGKNSYEEIFQ